MVQAYVRKFSGWWRRLPTGGRVLVGAGAVGGFYGLMLALLRNVFLAFLLLAIVGGALTLFLLVKWWVRRGERKQGRRVEATLNRRMMASGASMIDESKEERDVRQQLEQRWGDVHNTLQERSYDYYSFPWYLIVGPAQSGKTTTIQKSNQEFPIGDTPVVDYGGTRGCNWFFTNKAIIIDTAGRYVEHLGETEGEWNSMLARDQEEWYAFLDLLRDMRSRTAINGVILTIKLADIVEQDPERRTKLVETLRKALLDIEERLRIRIPVYVLVTMCDKLVGFVDFFSHLPGLADRSLFGWSRPGDFDAPFDAAEFTPGFGQLTDRLDRMLSEFMEAEASRGGGTANDFQKMDRLCSFPEEFRTLGAPLEEILARVFASSAYNEHHFFRGVYFTSGVQEGQPVLSACRDLVSDRHVQEEDISSIAGESKAYFIGDLYEEKIFREKGLIKMTARAQKEQQRKRIAYYGASALIALLVTWSVWSAAADLREVGKAPLQALLDLRDAPSSVDQLYDVPTAQLIPNLQTLADRVDQLDGEEQSILARVEIDVATINVAGAYRHLYADRVFAPLLGDFLLQVDQARIVRHATAEDVAKVLHGIHGVLQAHRDDQADDVEGFAALIELMGRVHRGLRRANGELNEIDYGGIGALTRKLELNDRERGDDDLQPLAQVRGIIADRLAPIQTTLRTKVVGFWQGCIEMVETAEPPDEFDAGAKGSDVHTAWYWSRLRELKSDAQGHLEALRNTLSHLPNIDALATFEQQVLNDWIDRFDRLALDLERMENHVKEHGTEGGRLANFVEERRKLFDAQREGLLVPIARSQTAASTQLQAALGNVQKNFETLGGRVGALAGALNIEGWGREAMLAQLRPWDAYVRHARAAGAENREQRGYLDPAKAKFLALADEKGFQLAFDELKEYGARGPVDGSPAELRTLLEKAEQMRRHLERRVLSAFFDELRRRFTDTDHDFLAAMRIDTSLVKGGNPSFSAKSAETLARVLSNLFAAFDQHESQLWQEARKARSGIKRLALDYFKDRFRVYWTDGIVGSYSADSAGALAKFITEGELDAFAGRSGDLESVRVLADGATFAGAQVTDGGPLGKVCDDIGGDVASNLRDDLEAIVGLWKHYETAANVAAVQQEATALGDAFQALAAAAAGGDELRFLKAAQEQDAAWQRAIDFAGKSAVKPDPFTDSLLRMGRAGRSGVIGRAARLSGRKWKQLLKFGEERSLVGKFPFVSVTSENRFDATMARADLDQAKAFLASPDLAFLATFVDAVGPSPAFGAERCAFVRDCARLRDLLRSPKPAEVLLYYGGGNESAWSNWEFVMEQPGRVKKLTLLLPFTQPKDVLWNPAADVQLMIRAAEAPTEQQWRMQLPFQTPPDKSYWTNFLAFCLAYETAEPPTGGQLEEGVRWFRVPCKLQGKGEVVSFGLGIKTTPPLPESLPDLARAGKLE